MTATTDAQTQIPGAGGHSHGQPVALVGATGSPAERFTSRDPDDFAVPKGREEDWRFTPLRKLRPLFQPFTPTGRLAGEVSGPDSVRRAVLPMTDPAVGRLLQPADRASALAFAGSEQAFVVGIPADERLAEPVMISARGEAGLSYAHLVIDAAPFSEATVVIDYSGSTTVVENVEIIVGDGAKLEVVSIQGWDADAIHLSSHVAQLGRDARLKHTVVNLGGAIIRLNPSVKFAGPGAEVELYGLSFAGPGQHQESRLYVDHSVAHCTSNVAYKSALDGETARTVWIGDVRIRPAAVDTSTYELNRNLLLTEGARADSVPNLEIETGEIAGAGHASATGRFDDLQLFYLESRGIGEDEARRLVVRGFFADIIKHITVAQVRDRLMATIDARLGASDPAEVTGGGE